MTYSNRFNLLPSRNNGTTLIVSLIVLLLVLLLGSAVANLALIGEKSARNAHDGALALFAAESALIDAELDIENSTATTSRSALFSSHSAAGFSNSCGSGERNLYQGLCLAERTVPKPIWQSADIANTGTNSVSVQFGRFTGRTMPTGHGAGPSRLPRYIIESMLDINPGQIAEQSYLYRITAIGFGISEPTQVVVQSVYRKSPLTYPSYQHPSFFDGKFSEVNAQPAIAHALGGGHLVLFGTGKYGNCADTLPVNFKTNSYYAIRDRIPHGSKSGYITKRGNLAQRILAKGEKKERHGYQVRGNNFIFGDGSNDLSKRGWFFDFADSNITGERLLSTSLIVNGNVYFNSFIQGQRCTISGSGNSYMLDLLTGKATPSQTITGIRSVNAALGKPIISLEKILPGTPDPLGRRIAKHAVSILNFSSATDVSNIIETTEVDLKFGRLSWREIQNWQGSK